jgi:hypothetical protein
MNHDLEDIIEKMEYFTEYRSHEDWPRFLEFLHSIGHLPVTLPDDMGQLDIASLFRSLPRGEWSLFFHTAEHGGTDDIFLLYRYGEEKRVVQFTFIPRSEDAHTPAVFPFHPQNLQHVIPLDDVNSITARFQYVWYYLNRLNPLTVTADQPLPATGRLIEGYWNALAHYRKRLRSFESGTRASHPRGRGTAKRVKLEEPETPFPEFDGDSGYARFFTPQTLTKYVLVLDELQRLYSERHKVTDSPFLDILVKVQSERLFGHDIYRLKGEENFRKYFPSGSPKPAKLRNLAGFLFELFRDLVQPEYKVIFGTPEQQARILVQLDKTPQGRLIPIVREELGEEESFWKILYRYLSARRWSDLTVST